MLSPALLRVTGLDIPVKKYLVAQLNLDTGDSLDVESFDISPNALHFKNIRFTSADKKNSLKLESIDIVFSLFAFFTNFTNPDRAIQTVVISRPELCITSLNADSTQMPFEADSATVKRLNLFLSNLNQFPKINSFLIKNGKIIYKTNKGKLVISEDVFGRIHTLAPHKISLKLNGSFFSHSEDRFELNSEIDLQQESIKTAVHFNLNEAIDQIPPLISENLWVHQGKISGKVMVEVRRFRIANLILNGEVHYANIHFSYDEKEIHNLSGKLSFFERDIKMDELSARYKTAEIKGEGELINILKPNASLTLTVDRIPVSDLVGETFPLPKKSVCSANAKLTFSKNKLNVTGKLFNHQLYLTENAALENYDVKFKYHDKKFEITEFKGHLGNAIILGKGRLNSVNKNLNLQLKTEYKNQRHTVFDRLSYQNHRLFTHIKYNLEHGVLSGNWTYSLASKEDTVIAANGEIKGRGNEIAINTLSSAPTQFDISAHVSDYHSKPKIEKVWLSGFPFHRLVSDSALQKPLERLAAEISLNGFSHHLIGEIILKDRKNIHNAFSLKTSMKNLLAAEKEISGNVQFRNLTGNYKIKMDEDRLNSFWNFPAGMGGYLNLTISDGEKIDGKVNFKNFQLMRSISEKKSQNDFRLAGNLNGSLHLEGTLRNPEINGKLNGDKFVFNDVGYYQTYVELKANKNDIKIDTLNIALNNRSIGNLKANYGFSTDSISLELKGSQLNLENLAETFTQKRAITGKGNYFAQLSGLLSKPVLTGGFEFNKGKIDHFEFDQIRAAFTDSLKEGLSLFSLKDHRIRLTNLFAEKNGLYHLYAKGTLPVSTHSPFNLQIKFDGDLFSFIPQLEPFFLKGASMTNGSLSLKGTPERVEIESAELNVERGELWLDEVVDHIKNINGKIYKKKGSNKVFIDNLTAFTENGESLLINTIHHKPKPIQRQNLKHWYFKGVDLDFGVLSLVTSGNGVELNLPGLMEKGDLGKLHLSGLNEDETFYLSGPARHPQARGVINLYDIRLTYPFLKQKDAAYNRKPSAAQQFLENLDWDVRVEPGEDVIFFRDIPAYIDNVNAELFVSENSPGLHFKGIINKGAFVPVGKLSSSRGRLEYLDQNFKVDHFFVEFFPYKSTPIVSGRAWTTIRDSIGAVPKTIYLKLYAFDAKTGMEKQQGDFENFRFKLESADPQLGETQEQVLAYMGFSVENIKEKAASIGGAVTERYLVRPLLRPIEKVLEKNFGIDFFRINSSIAKNLFNSTFGYGEAYNIKGGVDPLSSGSPYLSLMHSSAVTVGKYLSQDVYLSYTGQFISLYDEAKPDFGFNHSFGLEYRFLHNLLIELGYDRELMQYYHISDQEYIEDFKVRLKHSISF
jgi:hypothetical protein